MRRQLTLSSNASLMISTSRNLTQIALKPSNKSISNFKLISPTDLITVEVK